MSTWHRCCKQQRPGSKVLAQHGVHYKFPGNSSSTHPAMVQMLWAVRTQLGESCKSTAHLWVTSHLTVPGRGCAGHVGRCSLLEAGLWVYTLRQALWTGVLEHSDGQQVPRGGGGGECQHWCQSQKVWALNFCSATYRLLTWAIE